jgi:hypothetical protein
MTVTADHTRLSDCSPVVPVQVTAHEALFKLTEAEQVIKNSELSLEKTLAQGDLNRALGKLRYLKTIAAARKRATAADAAADAAEVAAAKHGAGTSAAGAASSGGANAASAHSGEAAVLLGEPASPRTAAAAAALKRAAVAASGAGQEPAGAHHKAPAAASTTVAAPQPAPAGNSSVQGTDNAEQTNCPICHDLVEAAAAVLPCGHILCCSCADALAARLPAALPQQQRRISCPTCRCRTHVSDVAYVDSGRSSTYSYIRTDSNVPGQQQQQDASGGGVSSPISGPRGEVSRGSSRRSSSDADEAAGDLGDAGGAPTYMWQAEQQLVVQGSYGESAVWSLWFVAWFVTNRMGLGTAEASDCTAAVVRCS